MAIAYAVEELLQENQPSSAIKAVKLAPVLVLINSAFESMDDLTATINHLAEAASILNRPDILRSLVALYDK